MKTIQLFAIVLMLFTSVVVTGCRKESGPSRGSDKSSKGGGHDDHGHGPGPHDGAIFDFGKWHAEFTVNHKTQEATVYILSTRANKPTPIPADKLLLNIKDPPFQVDLKAAPQEADPAGKSSRFVGKHENLGKEQEFEGTLSGVVDGTPYAGDFKEEEDKEHKHEKK